MQQSKKTQNLLATTTMYKVESGLQLLSRLTKKTHVLNFYPNLFENGLRNGEVVELCGNRRTSDLLIDIISELLLPDQLDDPRPCVLLFNIDGNFDSERLIDVIKMKMAIKCIEKNLNQILGNLYVLEIFEADQLYSTIHNLENILTELPSISLIIFDTLTAFYWSEQGFKITKMDYYLKNLLRILQKATRLYKISILYTRPQYFSSIKESIENAEACCEQPTLERLNFRIHLQTNEDDGTYEVTVRSFNKLYKKTCMICDSSVKWVSSELN